MAKPISRRAFVRTTAGVGGAAVLHQRRSTVGGEAGRLPVVVASTNGRRAAELAYRLIKERKHDVLEAVIAGVNIIEDDPEDNSVGYGGLPNEDCVVELDSSVMHGPTGRSGAVAALRDIRNPSKVAHMVMKRTDHALLVGEGALRFAVAHGFKREDLLTEKSRIAWLAWKESLSDRDSWGPGLASPDTEAPGLERRVQTLLESLGKSELLAWVMGVLTHRPQGTISCIGAGEAGELSGAISTSGLAWKMAGRVGDSPLIGAGLYVDNEVGAAGATGRGEECIRVSGAHTVVEMMRRGARPREAAMEAIKRIAANYSNSKQKLARFNLIFYALNKRGEHGAGALWNEAWRIDRFQRSQYIVADSEGVRTVGADYLFERTS
jgi:N4-(beta-N-acetylglucosaminyl)-L-asparaginase